jgi:hypothetical protein
VSAVPQLTTDPGVWNDRTAMWGATPRDRVKVAVFLTLFFLGPILGLIAINRYCFLDDRGVWVLVGLYAIAFPLSFVIVKRRRFPRGTPLQARVMARAGWTLSVCFWCLGVVGIVNGYGSNVITNRTVVCLGKRMTRQRDPKRRTYYVQVQPWQTTDRRVELSVRPDVWDALREGSRVRLSVGAGRLGMEWISDVTAADQ